MPNKNVQVAILRTNSKGVLALPIWLGGGAQYVPPQGAIQNLTFTVPLVPDGAEPWELSPVRVQSLQHQLKNVLAAVKAWRRSAIFVDAPSMMSSTARVSSLTRRRFASGLK